MDIKNIGRSPLIILLMATALSSCANHASREFDVATGRYYYNNENSYRSRLPSHIDTDGQKVVVVDPSSHVWGAYNANGELVKAGLATAGGNWCEDINRSCRTTAGTFRIQSLGNADCRSKTYPLPKGGGLMPYCMHFHNGMALHGSPYPAVIEDNVSHGCVRMRIPDAEWLRYNFANIGTKVVIKAY